MIISQRLAGELAAPDYFETLLPTPVLPNQKVFWRRFFSIGFIILSAFLALPRQAAFESSLTPDIILNLVNQDRAESGLGSLQLNQRLTRAAYAKAEHMLRHAYFAHTSPSGVEPWDFIKGQDFDYAFAGENLAINYTSSYELENDLLQSPTHRENLLSPLYSEMGIAVVEGKFLGENAVITVQLFASPKVVVAKHH